MKRIVFLALGALLVSPASAQQHNCRDIRTLLNVDGTEFRGLAWALDTRVGASLTVRGRRVAFPPATGCDLRVDLHATRFECTWEFSGAEAATAVYDRLLSQINACLSRPLLTSRASRRSAESAIMREDERSFVTRRRETDVSLMLYDSSRDRQEVNTAGDLPNYTIHLEARIDTERVASPEDVDWQDQEWSSASVRGSRSPA